MISKGIIPGKDLTESALDTGIAERDLGFMFFGTDFYDVATDIETGPGGDLFITGYTEGSMSGKENAGGLDVFVSRISNDGKEVWTTQWGGELDDEASSLVLDQKGNIFVTGAMNGRHDIPGENMFYDLFLSKLDCEGVLLWTKKWERFGSDYGRSIAVDFSGNVYIAGSIGSTGTSEDGAPLAFLIKLDSDGVEQWSKEWKPEAAAAGSGASGGVGLPALAVSAESVIVDRGGNIYVTGFTQGKLDGNNSYGSADIFVLKFSSEGVKQWSMQWGSTYSDAPQTIVFDSAGNLYIAGNTAGNLDGNINGADNGDMASSSTLDVFISRISTEGVLEWTVQWGTEDDDTGMDLVLDSEDNIYVTGSTRGVFSGENVTGTYEMFFMTKFSSDGTYQWTDQRISGGSAGMAVAAGASDSIYTTGWVVKQDDLEKKVDIFIKKYSEQVDCED